MGRFGQVTAGQSGMNENQRQTSTQMISLKSFALLTRSHVQRLVRSTAANIDKVLLAMRPARIRRAHTQACHMPSDQCQLSLEDTA